MAKFNFLDLTGLTLVKDKILEIINNHTSNNNIHTSTEEKNKLSEAHAHSVSAHAPTDAEKNIIVGVKKNGTDLTIDSSRKVNVAVPTKVSELENDTGFNKKITLSGTNYRKTVIALCKLSAINKTNNSYTSGRFNIIRKNGNYFPTYVDIIMCDSYSKNYIATYSILEDTVCGIADIKPCTFTYNGEVYGGLDIFLNNAAPEVIEFIGTTSFDIFSVDYYDVQNTTALVEEINNSLERETTVLSSNFLRHNKNIILDESNYKNYFTPYTHPSYTAKTSGLYKITVDETGHVSDTTVVTKDDITVLGLSAQDHVHNYLPLAGGDLSGNVNVVKEDATTTQVLLQNSLRKGGLSITSTGNIGLYDTTNSKWILSSDTDGNATFNGDSNTASKLKNSVALLANLGTPVSSLTEALKVFDGSADTNIGVTGTLPITNGGTGATTVERARTNLGLGSASTKNITSSVTNGSENLITSGGVYTALNNYLPKTGGTLDGNINIVKNDETDTQILLKNNLRKGTFAVSATGNIGMFDNTNSKWIFSSTPTGNATFNGNATTSTTASKLSSSAGDLNHPVYFKDGVPVICDSNIKSKVNVTTNDKSTSTDGVTGCVLAYTGRLHMTGDSTNNPGLTFYYNNSTEKTSAIAESEAGKINVDASSVTVKSLPAIVYSAETAYGTSLNVKGKGLAFGSTSNVTQIAGSRVAINCSNTDGFTANKSLLESSDKRIKTDSEMLDNTSEKYYKYIGMWDKMTPRTYKLLTDDEKTARFNLGYYAQEVEDALYDSGLTDEDFSGIATIDEYEVYSEDIADFAIIKNFKALSYKDCQMLTTIKLKQVVNEIIPELVDKISTLNDKVEMLQNQLNELKGVEL